MQAYIPPKFVVLSEVVQHCCKVEVTREVEVEGSW